MRVRSLSIASHLAKTSLATLAVTGLMVFGLTVPTASAAEQSQADLAKAA